MAPYFPRQEKADAGKTGNEDKPTVGSEKRETSPNILIDEAKFDEDASAGQLPQLKLSVSSVLLSRSTLNYHPKGNVGVKFASCQLKR
jgi:hypothetical protein